MEADGALRAAAPNLESIPNPPGGAGWSLGQCGCHRDPPVRVNSKSAEFRASVVLNNSCYVVLGLNWLLDPLLTIHDMDSGREKLIWIAILSLFLTWGAAKIDRKRLIVPFWKDLSLSIDILSAPEIPC